MMLNGYLNKAQQPKPAITQDARGRWIWRASGKALTLQEQALYLTHKKPKDG